MSPVRGQRAGVDLGPPEVMMPVPNEAATRMVEMQVLGQIRDSLVALQTEVRDQGKVAADTRERVIKIEAKDVEAEVRSLARAVEGNKSYYGAEIEKIRLLQAAEVEKVRLAYTAEIEKLRQERLKAQAEYETRLKLIELEFAKFKGLFVPLSIVGSAFLVGVAAAMLRVMHLA